MEEQSEDKILKKFLETINSNNIGKIKVSFRVSGGPPGKHLSKETIFFGDGNAKLRVRDELKQQHQKEASLRVGSTEIKSLFKQLGLGIDSLISPSKATFLPDSLIGSITIEVDQQKYTRYFLPNEIDRMIQQKPISAQMTEVIQNLEKISQQEGTSSNGRS